MKNTKSTLIRVFILLIIIINGAISVSWGEAYSNKVSDDRMLLVLSAPSVNSSYYKPAFQLIVDFQIKYAKAIMRNDNVVVIVDKDTMPWYEDELPEDILITANMYDIWMRDFTTVNPIDPVQFVYTWASMTKQESMEVQAGFRAFADQYGIRRRTSDLLIDGGNIVDNYAGRLVITTRFMEDNNLSYDEAKQALMKLLGASGVAILEPDDEVLAHSDGMVSWIGENTLLVNDYSHDPAFRTKVMNELRSSFPDIDIIEVPVEFQTNRPGQWDGFNSACGVNINALMTYKNLYVPVFDVAHDRNALNIIRQNTSKNLITIKANGVCAMGGSVRCLTWQLTGKNAEKLISAARKKLKLN